MVKSHQVAKILNKLSAMLEGAPDIDLDHLFISDHPGVPASTSQIAVNVSTLAELARIDKQQWLKFIQEYQLPIESRPRDATRDI